MSSREYLTIDELAARPLHLKWSAVQARLEEKDQQREEEESLISMARGYFTN
jgi:hypothetical protein